MEAISSVLISKALDGLAQRAMVTAENIANANTAHYRPLELRFEDQLRAAAARGADAVKAVSFRAQVAPQSRVGDEMRLDLELATASQTAMRYAALIDVLGREAQLTRAVVEGSR